MGVFKKLFGKKTALGRGLTLRDLIQKESVIGGTLFGPVPQDRQRQFFCLDKHSWVWHEEWTDEAGQHRSMTTRYEVRPTGILKAQGNQPYHYVTEAEEQHLLQAIELYHQHVMRDLYKQPVAV
jgi:hypothetical protein